MADPSSEVQVAPGEEVKPYKIHIPTKHLDLTKQKLELTRLPHEGSSSGSGNKSKDWWEPKPIVEPLIDFWLEKYSWREAESMLNNTLPQFRTTITLPNLDNAALRVHFIHARSPRPDAVPLLLVPPFPFTNLSLGHLIKPLTEPDAADQQAFNLVIPSLPGLGLSDALPANVSSIPASTTILDTLMRRLGYAHYLVTGSGPGHLSPAAIDFRVVNRLATHHADSCVGAHLIAPLFKAPTRKEQGTRAWVKWKVAKMLKKEKWGYKREDWGVVARSEGKTAAGKKEKKMGLNALGGDGSGLAEDPNTLAYALCDSPTGMLVFVLRGLRAMGLDEAALSSSSFTYEKIITLTNMLWLPGPETAMRYWAHCAAYPEDDTVGGSSARQANGKKTKVAITVFTGTGNDGKSTAAAPETTEATTKATAGVSTEALPALNKRVPLSRFEAAARSAEKHTYVCPAWGNFVYDVVFQERASGHAEGLLAFTRPEIVITGVKGLAKEVLAREPRLQAKSQNQNQSQQPQSSTKEQPQQPQQATAAGASSLTSFPPPSSTDGPDSPTVPLDKIVVVPASPVDENNKTNNSSNSGIRKSPSAVVALTPGTSTIPEEKEEAESADEEEEQKPHRGRSTKPEKGKAVAAAKVPPPPAVNKNSNLLNLPTRNQSEGESPDTLVNTPSPSPSS